MTPKEKCNPLEQLIILPQVLKWLAISVAVAALAGSASAGFLVSLEWATDWREAHLWMLALLPLGGAVVGWIYLKYGKSVEAGNNLLIDEIHDPKSTVPLRMTPLVLFGTVVSHLFGASVGREGTAVQMGGSLADQLSRPLRLGAEDRRVLLMAGVSAGFSSVFGTPLAGALFGLEVLAIGKLRYDALFPCFVAAILANQITLAFGVHHTSYSIPSVPAVSAVGLLSAVLAGAAFGVVGMLFAKATHSIGRAFKRHIAYAPLRPFVGGAVIALAVWALGTTRYIGLGIPTIVDAFSTRLPPWDFAAKFVFTTFSLGAGYKGGEVTPLFFIGATLGNALAPLLPLPSPLLAGMGFVAVFAGAANTPLSSTLMAIELFGPQAGIFAGVACVASYLFSGHASIYHSQRIGLSKTEPYAAAEGMKLSAFDSAKDSPALDPSEVPVLPQGTAILRLYFHNGAKLRAEGFWKKLTAPSLGGYLASQAKKAGIEQVVIHRVSYDLSEVPPHKLPQCAELIDREDKLRSFLQANAAVLGEVRSVLLRCDAEPLSDSAAGHAAARKVPSPVTE
jgi:H+/Cl- antiporter ClcA